MAQRIIIHDSNLTAQSVPDPKEVLDRVRLWAKELGFSQIGVAGIDLHEAEAGLEQWLAQGFHGQMHYMASHGLKRARPAELVPGTVSVITVSMPYLGTTSGPDPDGWRTKELQSLRVPHEGVISIYARGRDYHKVLRARLQQLQKRMAEWLGEFGHRVFCDSAPVLEVELASRSGLGWRGKHTLTLHRDAGSLFFLGELFVDLALPPTEAVPSHCGQCQACIAGCPTQAIVAPYRVDARRCISYLTIESDDPIPEALRPLVGNRIYGCDECQLVCPWNKFAQPSSLPDFAPRAYGQGGELVHFMRWDEATFLRHTEGSAIRRIGHTRWLRNVALAMGNAVDQPDLTEAQRADMVAALHDWQDHPSPVVAEQIAWSLARLQA